MRGKGGKLTIIDLLGPSAEHDEDEMSSSDAALKAAFKAIKADDFDGFKEAMTDWVSYCSKERETEDKGED